jgi:hypothetical protein
MSEITIPTLLASNVTFGLSRADVATELLTGAAVFTEFTKAGWVYQAQLVIQTYDQGQAWAVALSQLSRFSNHFKAGPPAYAGGAYTATTLQVDGASQLGTSLNIKNGNASTTVIRAGEYFEAVGSSIVQTSDDLTWSSTFINNYTTVKKVVGNINKTIRV